VTSACDLSEKRLRLRGQRRRVYWWCDDVAQARRRCIAARRLWTRFKRRGVHRDDLEYLFRIFRRKLCVAIKKAKAGAWNELLKTIDDDPWGMPYRIVMDRLRRSGPMLTESIEPVVVENVLDSLFPIGETHIPKEIWRDRNCPILECRVSSVEVTEAVRARRRGGCPAPGPDGLLIALCCLTVCVTDRVAELYTLCLEKGIFPRSSPFLY